MCFASLETVTAGGKGAPSHEFVSFFFFYFSAWRRPLVSSLASLALSDIGMAAIPPTDSLQERCDLHDQQELVQQDQLHRTEQTNLDKENYLGSEDNEDDDDFDSDDDDINLNDLEDELNDYDGWDNATGGA